VAALLNNKKNLTEDRPFVEALTASVKKYEALLEAKNQQLALISEVDQFANEFKKICQEVADVFISLKKLQKLNQNLVWGVNILVEYFVRALKRSL
jgi:hypothetical protein